MNKTQIITAILASASAFAYAQNNDAATARNAQVEASELQIEAVNRAEAELGEAPLASDLIWSERESLFIAEYVESNLSETGFAPSLTWTVEGWENVSGGDRSVDTSAISSLVTLGLEQDLEVLTGVKNAGRFGMTAFWNATNNDAFDVSANNEASAASNLFAPNMTRVFEIYYANEFELDDAVVSMRVGQLAADEDFMGVDYAGLFMNGNFGAMPGVASIENDKGAGFSQYALATFGVTLAYELDAFRAIVGIYNGNVGTDDGSANHGFDYELQDIAIWYEAGYSYELFGNAGYVMAGGNYHSGTFVNELDDVKEGFYSFYCGVQQDLVVTPEGDAIFGAFFRVGYAPQKTSDTDVYFDLGFNWFAPLPGRDSDVLGLGYSYIGYNDDFVGGDAGSSSMIELTYLCQLTPAITFQPAAQIYFDAENEDGSRETAFVIGARFEVSF